MSQKNDTNNVAPEELFDLETVRNHSAEVAFQLYKVRGWDKIKQVKQNDIACYDCPGWPECLDAFHPLNYHSCIKGVPHVNLMEYPFVTATTREQRLERAKQELEDANADGVCFGYEIESMSCVDCKAADYCPQAFDWYNFGYDCLADK